MRQLQRTAEILSEAMAFVAACCLVAMVLITTANIIMRRPPFFSPLLGAHELTAFFGAMVIAFALPLTQLRKGHIGVELIQSMVPPAVRAIIERVTLFVCGIVSAIIAWRLFEYALVLEDRSEVSMTLAIPFFPFIIVAGACFAVLALVLFTQTITAAAGKTAHASDEAHNQPSLLWRATE